MSKLYNIYAGISYNMSYEYSYYFDSLDDALDAAYEAACEAYESYAGSHGIPSIRDLAEENDLDMEKDADELEELWLEERDSWLNYKAVPTDEDGEISSYMHTDEAINEFDGCNAFLSNFFPCHFEYDGRVWKSAEAAFQAAKTNDPQEKEEIWAAERPGKAKRLGRKCTMRPDWEDVKIETMHSIVYSKFAQNEDLLNRLRETGDRVLIEGNYWHDNFWGVCWKDDVINKPGEHHNVLGAILMDVRNELE